MPLKSRMPANSSVRMPGRLKAAVTSNSNSDRMLLTLRNAVTKHRLFGRGETLVVALSGGRDSVAMLDILTRLKDFDLKLVVAHLNHSLREGSDGDELFCREIAAAASLPFETERVDVRKMALRLKLNLEDAGRRARIDFLDRVADRYSAKVVLAHHFEDQAETVLMRMLRGSGMSGLSGISRRNARGYIRPMLEIRRAEIDLYLSERQLTWLEDPSNCDHSFLRNRIRHELLPILEEYNPSVRSALVQTGAILEDEHALLSDLSTAAFCQTCSLSPAGVVCRIEELLALHPALLRRLLRMAFRAVAGTLDGLSGRHTEQLMGLLSSARPNSRLSLPHNVTALREYGTLRILNSGAPNSPVMPIQMLVSEPGEYSVCGGVISFELTDDHPCFSDRNVTFLDPLKFSFPMLLRSFEHGDRIRPFGMTGRKKVKNLFIDLKIPLYRRKNSPLLFCQGELLWIAGVTVSELCRLGISQNKLLKVSWRSGFQ